MSIAKNITIIFYICSNISQIDRACFTWPFVLDYAFWGLLYLAFRLERAFWGLLYLAFRLERAF